MTFKQLVCLPLAFLAHPMSMTVPNFNAGGKAHQQQDTGSLFLKVNEYTYPDNRKIVTQVEDNRTGDLAAIGRVRNSYTGQGHCSGYALISRKIVVTNAHCIFEASNQNIDLEKVDSKVVFEPGTYKGLPADRIDGEVVRVGTTQPGAEKVNDFAIIVLSMPINGNPLEVDENPKFEADLFFSAGYSWNRLTSGQSLTFVGGCKAFKEDSASRMILHYCSLNKGGSGGLLGSAVIERDKNGNPISFDKFRAVGINVGGRPTWDRPNDDQVGVPPSPSTVNYAIGLKPIVGPIRKVLEQVQAGVPYDKIQ